MIICFFNLKVILLFGNVGHLMFTIKVREDGLIIKKGFGARPIATCSRFLPTTTANNSSISGYPSVSLSARSASSEVSAAITQQSMPSAKKSTKAAGPAKSQANAFHCEKNISQITIPDFVTKKEGYARFCQLPNKNCRAI